MSIFHKASRRVLGLMRPIVPVRTLARLEMRMFLGYWPNLEHPTSFNEKAHQWKLNGPHPLSTLCVDKWTVRQYVLSKTNRPDILNDVYFVGTDARDIPFDALPSKFVIKATHGSGWNIFVHDKADADIEAIISRCSKWLTTKHSVARRNFSETHYDLVVPRVIVEKFIEDATFGIPRDYKFFCFSGNPTYVQVDSDRFGTHRRNFYDVDWREMDFRLIYNTAEAVPRPSMLNEMLDIAATLSADFDFCRIDLYNPNDEKVLFGEMTFVPECGLGRFYPGEWDYRLGALWHVPDGNIHPSNRRAGRPYPRPIAEP